LTPNCTKLFADTLKLSVWGRQSTFAGSPSIFQTENRKHRARSETRTYGFGSGLDRFSVIHSQPTSPMVEKPLSWFIKDIDIGDGQMRQNTEPDMFGHRPMRRRSRHECHFISGSHVPVGKASQFHNLTQAFLFMFRLLPSFSHILS